MEHFLLAIIPSEDIAINIRKLRTLIFKKFGLASSKALPEIIPIAFTKEIIRKEQFKNLLISSEMKSLEFISTDTNDIYLEINNLDFTNTIRKKISNYKSPGFIPLKTGFYIASAENDLETGNIIKFLNIEHKKTLIWKKNNLELIKIEISKTVWWEDVSWETIWEQRINLL
ncbi:MAG: hypothetical protein DRI73_10425 [Bacteroidetes bacterium]|nr:MAG: hypothetical protein DRI73_10425 [Bacteroidota bacterium]